MILICPKCRGKMKLPGERIPRPGAWARCPRCQERFYIEIGPLDQDRDGGSPGRQLLVRTSLEGPAYDISQLTVFPETASSSWLASVIAPLAAALIIAAAWFLQSFGGAGQGVFQLTVAFSPEIYGLEALKSDLAFLRKKAVPNRHLDYDIVHEGPEYRVFRFFLADRRQSCRNLRSLNLRSSNPEKGFIIRGDCSYSSTSEGPVVTIVWDGPRAILEDADGRQNLILDF